MLVWSWLERRISSGGFFFGGGGGGGGGGATGIWVAGGGGGGGRWNVGVAIGVTAMAGLALAATLVISSRRGSLKSPWSRRKRKRALSLQQWNDLFLPDGKLRDGVKFLKKVRSGGIDPSIRAKVWPFLLGVYELSSSEEERNATRIQKRKEYKKLRRQCQRLLKRSYIELKEVDRDEDGESPLFDEARESPCSEDASCPRQPISIENGNPDDGTSEDQVVHSKDLTNLGLTDEDKMGEGNHHDGSSDEHEHKPSHPSITEEDKSGITHVDDVTAVNTESSDTESSGEEEEDTEGSTVTGMREENYHPQYAKMPSLKGDSSKTHHRTAEDFATWQRIIRLDAVRANSEWIDYAPSQAAISEDTARLSAEAVGLKDYEHLEPCRIYHAARLVAILEAYATYDPEIGYCQGMSDLLTPILAVMEEDHLAFWCFVGFMRKARHNFRLDEVGIRRQLGIVSKIIKSKDSHLYRHLEKLQAEDCFFVYRMVVVLFRRELSFEQTLCLWEVMWADQAALRAGIGRSAWGRIRLLRAPPTDDLLLYAIAACVLQKRKLILEKYSSMDEIIRECNSMTGQLDVWKLLDDAHDLVVTLHDRI